MADDRKFAGFVCTGCGIGDRLDAGQLEQTAKRDGKMTTCQQHEMLCSQAGVQMIRDTIESEGATNIMIAACSRRAKVEAFNFTDVAMSRANLREGVIWSRPDTDENRETTQEMADDYIRMACAEVKFMTKPNMSGEQQMTKDILVVGGGVTGMTAALETAAAGFPTATRWPSPPTGTDSGTSGGRRARPAKSASSPTIDSCTATSATRPGRRPATASSTSSPRPPATSTSRELPFQAEMNEVSSQARVRQVLYLLTGQIFFVALALALLEIAGAALFLVEYGSEKLPWVYLGIAVFVSALSYLYSLLQKRRSLAAVSIVAFGTFAGLLFAARLGLLLGWNWIAFALMVAVALGFQMTLVVIGGQAGRLFDVRQMKRLFPLVMTGLVVGFMSSGLLLPLLRRLLGATENLLLVAGASMAIALGLLLATIRRFRPELTQVPEAPTASRPWRSRCCSGIRPTIRHRPRAP